MMGAAISLIMQHEQLLQLACEKHSRRKHLLGVWGLCQPAAAWWIEGHWQWTPLCIRMSRQLHALLKELMQLPGHPLVQFLNSSSLSELRAWFACCTFWSWHRTHSIVISAKRVHRRIFGHLFVAYFMLVPRLHDMTSLLSESNQGGCLPQMLICSNSASYGSGVAT